MNQWVKLFSGDYGIARDTLAKTVASDGLYRKILDSKGLDASSPWDAIPVLDKDSSYFQDGSFTSSPFATSINGLYLSSGSSGQPFFWPSQRDGRTGLNIAEWADSIFALRGKKTLGIVCFSTNAWSAGVNTAIGLAELTNHFPGSKVIIPGTDFEKAVEQLKLLHSNFNIIFVGIYSVAIPYFLDLAKRQLPPDAVKKLRFGTTGDPFPESLRISVESACGVSWPEIALGSYSYSSADTRVIGNETRATIALRKLIYQSDKAADMLLGQHELIPNIYRRVPVSELELIEVIDGEFVFTRWQPIPLVRYNLHDKGEIWSAQEIKKALKELRDPSVKQYADYVADHLGDEDLIAMYGRSKSVYLYGIHLEEYFLKDLFNDPAIQDIATGLFTVEISGSTDYPKILWTIELKNGIASGNDIKNRVFHYLLTKLDSIPSCYKLKIRHDDFIRNWDRNPEKSIFDFSFIPYPSMTEKLKTSGKHRYLKIPEKT